MWRPRYGASLRWLVVLLGVVMMSVVAGCGSSSSSAPPTQGQILAAIQEGKANVSANDSLAVRIDSQLDLLQPDCTNTRVKLASAVNFAYTDLPKYGIHETIPSILLHVRRSIPASSAPIDCVQIVAAYLVLREG